MLSWYRDILTVKAGGGVGGIRLINSDKRQLLTRSAKAITMGHIEGVIAQILATEEYLEQNANPKLAMSVLGLKIMEGCEGSYVRSHSG